MIGIKSGKGVPMSRIRIAAVLALLLALAPELVQAQTGGRVRTQGRDVTPEEEQRPDFGAGAAILDYREEMRRLIQNISAFARSHNPNFAVIPQNGLDLLERVDPIVETRKIPARTYIRSIDGVLQEGLFYGYPEIGKATEKDRQEQLLHLTALARKNRLGVLVMDYASAPKAIDAAYRKSAAKGFIPFVAPNRGPDLNAVPRYPRRPFNEAAGSVLSARQIKNFLYLGDTLPFGRQDQFALTMHQNNYDMIVVDVYHGRRPLTRQAVETLRFKRAGGKRLVLAFANIGSAENHRYYWKPHWREGSPLWIKAPYPGNADRFYVEYWHPAWHKIITGNTNSYIYGIIAQGYDGVILDGIEAYRYFEGEGGDVVIATQ